MDLSSLRNIGIAAHIDAGKTTLSERILFFAGVLHRMGEVHDGNTVMDWMEEERRRGITITAAATRLEWLGHPINLIDTPGHVDFTVEVERCMRVLDGAVLVVNGVAGVQAQSETVWRQMRRHGVPHLAFVNQLDRPGAEFLRSVGDLSRRLGVRAIALQHPLGVEREFHGTIDLVGMRALDYRGCDQGRDPRAGPVPPELEDAAGVLRAELIEVLSEEDDQVLAAAVEGRDPGEAALWSALRRRVLTGSLLPAFAGSALRNIGVQPLLDAVVRLLPSPLDRGAVAARRVEGGATVELRPDPDGPPAALAFKLTADPHEDLTYVRIYSGRIQPGQKLYNPRVGRMERIARVLRMHADERRALETASAGDIVALTGLKLTSTGDTLGAHEGAVVLERLNFPEPVITKMVEPLVSADRDRLRAALERLEFEDPTLRTREDPETGQWLIAGMGELHLEIAQHRLERDFHLGVRVGQPRVAYREAVLGPGRGEGRVERQLGGKEVFGALSVEVLPSPEELTPELAWSDDCLVPRPFRAAVEETLRHGAETGPRFGFPLVHARLRVTGGESHPARDAELAFAQAASQALRAALAAAPVAVLEPVMALEAESPAEFGSGVIADLNSRRAEIQDVRSEGDLCRISARVPLSQAFGYSTALRSLSQGRAAFSMTPAGFQPVSEAELEVRGLVWS